MNWANFTFEWDVGAEDPLTVIDVFGWEGSGGKFEDMSVMCDDGIVRRQRMCNPTAFTKQEL